MANEKVIQTRLSLKIDTYANWTNLSETGKGGNLVLNKGEIGLCEIPVGNGAATTAPTVLFKVGDGTLPFHHTDPTKCLKWASALAADVYDWAKKPQAEFEAWVKTLVPVNVVDNDNGKFVTDVAHSSGNNGRTITITRDDAVNTLAGGNGTDNIITTKVDKSKGDVKLTADHAKKGPTNGYTGGQATTTAQVGKEMTIKVPKLTVDAYGHTTAASDVDYKITIPQNVDTWRAVAVNGTIHLQKTDDEILQIDDGGNIEVEWDEEDRAVVISHGAKPTTGTKEKATAGTGRVYVTEVLTDAYGHIAGVKTAEETDQVIDWATEVPANETALTITNKPTTPTLEEGLIYAVTNLEEGGTNGHEVTATYEAVATKNYVDKKAAGAVDYLGTLSALNKLSTTASKGDFYRVSAEIKSGDTILAYVGDLVIAEKDKPAAQIDGTNWTAIHCGDGDISAVIAGSGLTGGGATGGVTLAIDYNDLNSKYLKIDGGNALGDITINLEEDCYFTYNGSEVATHEWVENKKYLTSVPVTSVAGKTGDVKLDKTDVGLENVDNTADKDKEVKYATNAGNLGGQAPSYYATAASVTNITKDNGIIDTKIANKADKVSGATAGNFAALDATGNLTDSGKKAADFAPAPGEKNDYLELVNTGNTGVVTEAASGFDTINFNSVELQVDGNEVLTTASTISTDKLVGGSEIWIIDCGTSTTVI